MSDPMNGFQREKFERGITLFGTMMVRIGIWATDAVAQQKSAINIQRELVQPATDYIEELSSDDVEALLVFLDAMNNMDWGPLILLCGMRAIELRLEAKLKKRGRL